MDAKKYLEELTRMCNHYKGNCAETGCPLADPFEGIARYCPFMPNDDEEYAPSIKMVERWADAHPIITNGDVINRMMENHNTRPADEPFRVIVVKQSWWDEEYKEP